MYYSIKRSQEEIDEQLNRADEAENDGKSAYPGMSYEQGVKAALIWLLFEDDEEPPIPE